jgi:hypothetical protein
MAKKNIDLVYFGYEWEADSPKLEKEYMEEIVKVFPDLELRNAYDDIKGYRRSVFADEAFDELQYLAWAFSHGWSNCSMSLALLFMSEDKDKRDEVVELGRKLYPECYKPVPETYPEKSLSELWEDDKSNLRTIDRIRFRSEHERDQFVKFMTEVGITEGKICTTNSCSSIPMPHALDHTLPKGYGEYLYDFCRYRGPAHKVHDMSFSEFKTVSVSYKFWVESHKKDAL